MPEPSDRAAAEGAHSPLRIQMEQTSWLSPSVLALVGSVGEESDPEVTISLPKEGGSTRLDYRWLALGEETPTLKGPEPSGVFVMTLPDLRHLLHDDAAVVWKSSNGTVTLTASDLTRPLADLQTFVRRNFAPLDASTRAKVSHFLASVSSSVPKAERDDLSARLFEVREALRERLPQLVMPPNRRFEAHVDRLLAVDERSFYIEGWIHQEAVEIVRLTAISPEGSRVELTELAFRYSRPDVTEFLSSNGKSAQSSPGFICFFELEAPSVRPVGWILEIESEDGVALEVAVPLALIDAVEVKDVLLLGPYTEEIQDDEFMSDLLFPAISRVQRRLYGGMAIESCVQFGTPPESPDVSIVVPLMQQIGQLEVQLSQFADDPELFEADLIYLLDSPEAVDALEHAADIFPIYRVPFRVAMPEQTLGFAEAANAGAGIAQGRLLLLMEPDVIPAHQGWLGELRRFYDATPAIGALAPKLLYEDDSIQAAGLYFEQRPGSSVWTRAGYFKGMHRALPAANVARSVAALSRACLMIDRALYDRLGGLPETYVGEAHDASDLCLQLSSEGFETWYLPAVELYHPEAPSGSRDEPRSAQRYDAWLHDHRWGERIALVMEGHDLAGFTKEG